MSIIRPAILRLTGRHNSQLIDPSRYPDLEQYTKALARLSHAGKIDVTEAELAELVAVAAQRYEQRVESEREQREEMLNQLEARELYEEHLDSVTARVWAILGWNEDGAPDGSGPVFPGYIRSVPPRGRPGEGI